jgi:PAS domain S-box-containing protein
MLGMAILERGTAEGPLEPPEGNASPAAAPPGLRPGLTGETPARAPGFAPRRRGAMAQTRGRTARVNMDFAVSSNGVLNLDASALAGPADRERFLTTVLETIASLVLVLDREGRIVFFNRACERTTGYTFDEVRGRHPWDLLLRPEDVPPVQAVFGKLRAGQSTSYDNVWVTKDGRLREIAWTNTILGGADGTVQWVIPTGIDITERRATERRLVDSERRIEEQQAQSSKLEAIGRLAGGVAHDFNNLLVVILGEADALREALPEDSALRDGLDQILEASRKAASLTSQLLAFGRKQVLRPVPLDVDAVVEEMRVMLQRLVGESVRLVAVRSPGPCHVIADPAGLQQILMNLVVNARDAMPEGGAVTVSTVRVELSAATRPDASLPPGPYVLLSVRDTGIGMTEEIRSRVFEPFFTTKAEGRGTGLGLSTVFGIVKQVGGHVVVCSAPGAGTRFDVYLPEVPETATAAAAARVVGEVPRGDGRTVLVVEDDPAVLGIAVRFLEDGGYRVLASNDPREALALAAAHAGPLDALVTDVIMPRLNGREVAHRLRARRPTLGVLFVSGYTGEVIARSGVLEPGVHFVPKPFSREDLLRGLAGAIAARPAQAPRRDAPAAAG